MAKSLRGNEAQFTYDFGIAIAQSTVTKLTRLTGATLTLASAFYALKTTANQYVDILRSNSIRFGGAVSTLKMMEDAQNRLLKGQSYFSVEDQLKGMNRLMSVGIELRENLDWVNKAAHATGMSYLEFSNMITSAIQGNSQALVDAGLMTQRATRIFDKYAANTVMRQKAIMNFLKTHKGLSAAIRNDYETVEDQTRRIKATWSAFLKSIVGRPNDPNSFYGQIVYSMKMVAVAFSRNAEQIKRYGFVIGQTLGWVIRQIGHFVVWVGRQAKKALQSIWNVTGDFENQTRSLLVWLEFWKQKILDFFRAYGDEIKTILKLLVAFKALKTVFVISDLAIASVIRYKRALTGLLVLQKRYTTMMGPLVGNKFTRWLQSLAVFMPRWLRKIWVSVGKFFERGLFAGGFSKLFKGIGKNLFGIIPIIKYILKALGLIKNFFLGSNPVGWIILAITLVVTLYNKVKSFRTYVITMLRIILELAKSIWNSLMYAITWVMVGIKKVWGYLKSFFTWAWDGIKSLWDSFKDTTVGKFVNDYIVQPLVTAFEWIAKVWKGIVYGLGKALEWLGLANTSVSEATKNVAEKYGVYSLPTFEGGKYDKEETEQYNPFKSNTKKKEEEVTENPILKSSASVPVGMGGSSGSSTSIAFSSGAIQIIVQKGESIDEEKLARKVKQVISDIKRDGDMRGGIA